MATKNIELTSSGVTMYNPNASWTSNTYSTAAIGAKNKTFMAMCIDLPTVLGYYTKVNSISFSCKANSNRNMWAQGTMKGGYSTSIGSSNYPSNYVEVKDLGTIANESDTSANHSMTLSTSDYPNLIFDNKIFLCIALYNNIAANNIKFVLKNIVVTIKYNQEYTISTDVIPTGTGRVIGGGTHEYGTTATLTAEPNVGYKFTKWQDGNTTNPRTVEVTSDKTYTAYFEVNTNIYRSTKKQIAYKGTKGVGKVAVYKSTKKIYG